MSEPASHQEVSAAGENIDVGVRASIRERARPRLRRALQRARYRRRVADTWFWDHYDGAPCQIEEFLAPALRLEGHRAADLGCGDGIMALGVTRMLRPSQLIGFDVNPVDTQALLRRATAAGVAGDLPANLSFLQSQPEHLPVDDDSFDIVYSWSAFEHVANPRALLCEVRRILAPGGAFFLQLWPFYFSPRGSHLWEWFPEDFHHLLSSEEEITEKMRSSHRHPPAWTDYMAHEFTNLNRMTVDDLGEALAGAGLTVRKLQLISESAHVPTGLDSYSLSQLGISGVKLIAAPG